MSNNFKNISIILGIITIAFAGYYIFSQTKSDVSFSNNDQVMQNMLANSRVFINRRHALDQISLDLRLLEDERFRNLRSFTKPLVEPEKGKDNIFSEIEEAYVVEEVSLEEETIEESLDTE